MTQTSIDEMRVKMKSPGCDGFARPEFEMQKNISKKRTMKLQRPLHHVSELLPGASSFHQTTTSVPASKAAMFLRKLGALCQKGFLGALTAHVLLACAPAAQASQNTPLNGSSPRPFYVVGHNPNTLADVDDALGAGANALEPDIQAMTDCDPGNTLPLRIMHGDPCGADAEDLGPTLDDFLEGIHAMLPQHPQLSLIVFDIKHAAATADRGEQILDSIHKHLNYDGVQIHVILSVAETNDGAVFDNILGKLGPLEGVMVDDMENADQVVDFFFKKGYFGNIGYGDGTLGVGPNLPRALDKAAWLRAATGFPRAVTYVFTLNHATSENSFIDGGVDGIIPDHLAGSYGGASWIKDLIDVVKAHTEIRMATPADDPFTPALESYGLAIQTSDIADAGTDADLTFTIKGCRGTSSNTVNTGSIYLGYDTARMRQGNPDWTTIPSKDLGKLQTITVHNDGVAQDGWHLKEIRVSSARWLGPDWNNAREYVATFNNWINPGETFEIPLVPSFVEPVPTIQCPPSITVSNDLNQCGAIVNFAPPGTTDPCDDLSPVCNPPSGSLFSIGTTMVTCSVTNSSAQTDTCTFNVTVVDMQIPVIACPLPIVANATSPSGVVVSFAPSVSDNCPGTLVTCVPTSGSVFAIGTNAVSCTATDASGNQASCGFTIHVKGAAEQTADLLAAVNSLVISKPGVKTALLSQLNATLASIQSNHLTAACGSLQSFILAVNAQVKSNTISAIDGDYLIKAAKQIQAVIGCK
jgi:hypothetical protein